MDINKKLLKDIEEYCKFNNIEDIEKEVNNILRVGFNVIRFGTKPFDNTPPKIEEIKKEEEAIVKKKVGRKKKIEETQVIEPILESETKTEEPIQVKKVRIIKNK